MFKPHGPYEMYGAVISTLCYSFVRNYKVAAMRDELITENLPLSLICIKLFVTLCYFLDVFMMVFF